MKTGTAIVVGASSGIGYSIARRLIADGWTVTVAARRTDLMLPLRSMAPERVTIAALDATRDDADRHLLSLITQAGGIDLYVHVAGRGKRNPTLAADIEMPTVALNADAFCRLVGAAYRYFAAKGTGHIAAVTSIAGTKGLGPAPAYSATKALQATYLEALTQHARTHGHDIATTDIRPGFVRTALLSGDSYPMLMDAEEVARSAVKAIYRRRHVTVVDRRWRLLNALWSALPHCLWRRMKIEYTHDIK